MKNIICHAEKERCIKIGEQPLPLCSRCTGVYIGMLIGLIIGLFILRIYECSALKLFYVTLLFAVPAALDGFMQEMMGKKSSNTRRLITGFLLGWIMGLDIMWISLRVIRYQ